MYIEHPNKVRTDRESDVNSILFHDLSMINGIKLLLSPVEAYDAIGAGGRYHALLRRIYSVLQTTYLTLSPQITL